MRQIAAEPPAVRPRARRGATRSAGRALLLMSFLGACSGSEPSHLAAPPPDASPPHPAKVTCLGRIVPGEKLVCVAAPPQSIVSELRVTRNERVRQGQVVAVLQRHDLYAATVVQAAAEVEVAAAELEQVRAGEKPAVLAAQAAIVDRCQADAATARSDQQRAQALAAKGMVSAADLEHTSAELRRAEFSLLEASERLKAMGTLRPVDIRTAEKRLVLMQAALARAQAEADLCLVRAPMSGVVVEVTTQPGEAVAEQGLLMLADIDHMMVEAEVHVSDIACVKPGAAATITGEGIQGVWTGKVAEVIHQVSPNSQYAGDPFTFSDLKTLKARVALAEAGAAAALLNASVDVEIQAQCE